MIALHYPKDISEFFLRKDGYQRGSFEMAVNICREHKRLGTVVDIGAHIGTWSMRFIRNFRRVIAIEANEEYLPWLRCNAPTATIIHAFIDGSAKASLDTFVDESVDLIKIDIDAPIGALIAGAHRLLTESKPIICAEMIHNDIPDDAGYDALMNVGYREIAHYNKDFMFVTKGGVTETQMGL